MGVIKIRNTCNLTTEQVQGKTIEYKWNDYKPIPFGVVSHVDKDYLYIYYDDSKEKKPDLMIDFNVNVSMEIGGDKNV